MSPVTRSRLPLLLAALAAALGLLATGAQEWAAWLFIYASFAVTGMDRHLRGDRMSLAAVWAGLVAHHGASLVNVYLRVLPGAEHDAATFHTYARHIVNKGDWPALTIGSDFYESFLSLFYRMGGNSLLLGQSLSVLAFALACLVFARVIDLTGVNRYRPWLLLLFGLLPSAVILGSVTLREPFELLLFMLGAYGGLRAFCRPVWWSAPLCIAALLAMGFFHQLLLIYGAIAAFAMCAALSLRGGMGWTRRLAVVAGVAVVVAAGISVMKSVDTPMGDDYLRMVRSGVIEAVVEYRKDVDAKGPRTAFNVEIDDSSHTKFAQGVVLTYAYYIGAPFPWQVAGLLDAYAALEAMLRVMLLAAALAALWQARRNRFWPVLILMGLFFSMTFMWALGTTNYGQAIRHHLLSNWIIIIVGGPLLARTALRVAGGCAAALRSRLTGPA